MECLRFLETQPKELSLLVVPFRFFVGLMPGLLLMLPQLRLGVPAAVDNGLRLFSSWVAVFPLPGMIVHPGPRSWPFITCAVVFAHTIWSHEAPDGGAAGYPV